MSKLDNLFSIIVCNRCKKNLKSFYIMGEDYEAVGEKYICEDCYNWDKNDPNSKMNKK